MNNKKLLIASSSRSEAITKWILNTQSTSPTIDVVFIGDLLNKYDIQDRLSDKEVCIQWYKKDKIKYSNHSHHLLNRIIYIERELFGSFKAQDQDYARREFEAYLGFALNSFVKVQNIAVNGVCEQIYSLPQQWNLIKEKLNLPIPNYYWGAKSYFPFGKNINVVHSTIFNFLNWSASTNSNNLTGFCFEKPIGEPIFILSVGSSRLITANLILTDTQLDILEKALYQIKRVFNYFIFELLVFVNKNELSFGCVNIEIIRSQSNPLFSDFLHHNLLQEYYNCLN